ncbi:MAG: rhodanese-like domain-containing protein [Desulfobacterium sp.]|jgi:3-mercaptopyruvate sulfurtransferase SseA|nr:rhodanese-like domain-containing protein [Desulfobacterium sp.]
MAQERNEIVQNMVQDFKGGAVLLIVSICCALAFNSWSDSGIALKGQWDRSQGVVSPMEKNTVVDGSREINDLDTMVELVNSKRCTLVDVRSNSQFDAGHLPGAVSLPIEAFDQMIGDFFVEYPLDTCLVVYCAGRECLDSHRLAHSLKTFGFFDIRIFSGGFADWMEGGLSVEIR